MGLLGSVSFSITLQKMNNDTPRTNANAVWPASNDDSDRESPDGSHVPVDFARELERENTRLREALTNCARTLRTHREDGVSITALAERRGLKMSDVLKAAGINHSTWWRWQRGKYQPRAESVERIKKALNAKKK